MTFGLGGAAVDREIMGGATRAADSASTNLGYGVRFGPTAESRWTLAAHVEGFTVNEKDQVAGALLGVGRAGLRALGVLLEASAGVGAMGIGSLEEGEVAPAFSLGLDAGFGVGSSLRFYLLRMHVVTPVLPDRTDVASGLFLGIGGEWTPAEPEPER
jgi:hypothetical protein